MPETHVDYRDLTREKKLEVLDSLATMAVDIVVRHPNILEHTLIEFMVVRHEYGYVACLGIYRAVKHGKLVAHDDGYHTVLNPTVEQGGE